ncbi:ABC-type branched-subunit amino acid transport system substrate-binding protein/predicted small secreted protein [Streptomyces achromogenes]|uniref:ABC-type branched-subunit amino acid transport system substrate-binding protein/predicted small secreted protein n=1 Tax=Streptomyces achromogenes TaxID=67255 RepID=A0ABU0PUC4_STRAH|nr:ABC transporter substrate-binding protein [Streptomyces achromogenes]MDQ0681994.1 ABC-type branched-subunit amino acid transport system substrate-binding protein/predicted small secreted protein [Streptomyces achromogenes]
MRRMLIGTATVVAVLLAGCSTRSGDGPDTDSAPRSSPAAEKSSDFGTLKDLCGPGTARSSSVQGVTDDKIQVGVMSDIGFTKRSEFVDAAKVFTSWCNDAGGINGRDLVPVTRDAKLMEVRQRVLEACKADFALVGGGSALDSLGVKDRLKCLLPNFPAQSSQIGAIGSDLQVLASGPTAGYFQYAGYYSWLLKDKYPDSARKVGVIAGDAPVTKVMAAQFKEAVAGLGGTVSYSDLYPAAGVSDWTPYAQSIKKGGVKGLVFLGDFASLAKLEQALTGIGYTPDWIDANSNAYGPAFPQLAGAALGKQHNYAELFATAPLESAGDNPAVQQVIDLFEKYAPGKQVTYPALRAFSAWLLFATAARDCAELTRKCLYENAMKNTAFTAGGLQAPFDLTSKEPPECYVIVEATAKGWQAADFRPDHGAYRCDAPTYKYKGDYGKPVTLADVGKSLADLT